MFLPCDPDHALCGQLQCGEGQFTRGDVAGSLRIFTSSVRVGGVTESCMSFTTLPDSDTMSPGLVQDGTKCGNGTVSYSSLAAP